MSSVTALTAARTLEILGDSIVGATIPTSGVNINKLVLTTRAGATIVAGTAVGPTGPPGSVSGVGTTDNAVVRANGTAGTAIQGSPVVIDDTGNITLPAGGSIANAPTADTHIANKAYVDKQGKGLLGLARTTVLENAILNAWKPMTSLQLPSFTPVVGRYYRFCAQVTVGVTVAGSISVDAGAALLIGKTSDSTNIAYFRGDTNIGAGSNAPATITIDQVLQIPAGWNVPTAFIPKIFVNNYLDVRNEVSAGCFYIEDLGPSINTP